MKWMVATMLVGSTMVGSTTQLDSSESGNSIDWSTNQYYDEGGIFPINQDAVTKYRISETKRITLSIEVRKEVIEREKRAALLVSVLKDLRTHVGKTPYVFAGSTPGGWDCSGLVMWTYKQLGVDVPHSASAQMGIGTQVTEPVPGDIVVWGGGYHSGIYLGEEK